MRTTHAIEVSHAMKVYWAQPGTRERRRLQAKVREREMQLARLERRGLSNTDRYCYIKQRLDEAREQLEQL